MALLDDLKHRMDSSLESFKKELSGLRTGRANVGMLEPVMVEAYGNMMPLNQVGTISVAEPRMLTVQVWDKGMAKSVERLFGMQGWVSIHKAKGSLSAYLCLI
jgi:ribosome recycling factor